MVIVNYIDELADGWVGSVFQDSSNRRGVLLANEHTVIFFDAEQYKSYGIFTDLRIGSVSEITFPVFIDNGES